MGLLVKPNATVFLFCNEKRHHIFIVMSYKRMDL